MYLKNYDVIVVGAGHAGVEAALAAARRGCRTLVLTTNLDNIALMSCNPSIGGPAKGHLVREIDALGGQMGLTTDATFLQMRLLNTGKGPAVQALRAQVDKKQYQAAMRSALEAEPLIDLKQAMVADLWVEAAEVRGVITQSGITYGAKAVVLTTGTYLEGKTIMGEKSESAGPSGQLPARGLSGNLRRLGLRLGRFKTGTPPRLDGRTVNYRVMTPQFGDDLPISFSYLTKAGPRPQLPCWLTHTTEQTHTIIRDNLHRAPMYSGLIEGRGPRYCPSIEDKIVRFADKQSHQVFLEPEGWHSYELYALGVSTSLPEEVQIELLRSIPGLEEVEIMRPGYAIEYDYLIATQLQRSLEVRGVQGLFAGGQINGTSGYEEAAAQGLVAGANAAARALGQAPLLLSRSDGYIGVLIDDLITKESFEPYRMMTSRAEFRLLLRMENADLRLTALGRQHGLISDERWARFEARQQAIENELERLSQTQVAPTAEIQAQLETAGSSPLRQPSTAEALLRRPELTYPHLVAFGLGDPQLPDDVQAEVTTQIKYQGYVTKQLAQVERQQKLEGHPLPAELDYTSLNGLSNEAQEKLNEIRPETVGQATRIAGVSPADISVLLVYLEQRRRHQEGASNP